MLVANNDMVNQTYKLLTADLSQVCNDRSTSTVNEFASASIKESRTDVRYEENNDKSVIAKMFEDTTPLKTEIRSVAKEDLQGRRDAIPVMLSQS